ncbi:hypothetical protein HRG_012545 [Hirsutella rhossiliensis]
MSHSQAPPAELSSPQVFILLVPHYVAAYDPRKCPFATKGSSSQKSEESQWVPNPIDEKMLSWLRGGGKALLIRLPTMALLQYRHIDLGRALNEAIVNICDIQIVTDAGILISGFVCLNGDHPLSAYHWKILVHLAWFASVTHLAGLAAIRQHPHLHLFKRNIRVALMACVLTALLVAMVPTGFFVWGYTASYALVAGLVFLQS